MHPRAHACVTCAGLPDAAERAEEPVCRSGWAPGDRTWTAETALLERFRNVSGWLVCGAVERRHDPKVDETHFPWQPAWH